MSVAPPAALEHELRVLMPARVVIAAAMRSSATAATMAGISGSDSEPSSGPSSTTASMSGLSSIAASTPGPGLPGCFELEQVAEINKSVRDNEKRHTEPDAAS